jgi:hypothetical protein
MTILSSATPVNATAVIRAALITAFFIIEFLLISTPDLIGRHRMEGSSFTLPEYPALLFTERNVS